MPVKSESEPQNIEHNASSMDHNDHHDDGRTGDVAGLVDDI